MDSKLVIRRRGIDWRIVRDNVWGKRILEKRVHGFGDVCCCVIVSILIGKVEKYWEFFFFYYDLRNIPVSQLIKNEYLDVCMFNIGNKINS